MAKDKAKQLGLESIKAPPIVPATEPDTYTNEERADHIIAMRALQRESIRQDIDERKDYARKIFNLMSWWLAAVFAMLIASGWKGGYFNLSDHVLLGILGGTTINVIGLFAIVAKYLFRDRTDASQLFARKPKKDK